MTKGKAILNEVGQEAILDLVAEGKFLRQIAERYGVGLRTLQEWLNESDERRAAYQAARELSAEAAAEKAERILSDAKKNATTMPQVALAKERAKHYRWLAKVRNRNAYGEQPAGVNVNFHAHIGKLHLDALRRVGRVGPAAVVEGEFEILESKRPQLPGGDDVRWG